MTPTSSDCLTVNVERLKADHAYFIIVNDINCVYCLIVNNAY